MFEWDQTKRRQVLRDHGIDLAEITDIFDDPYGMLFEDVAHSTDNEMRFAIIGQTARYGLIYAAYLYMGEVNIRFITARRAESWMVNCGRFSRWAMGFENEKRRMARIVPRYNAARRKD